MKKLKIAVTGGIASGKSLVCQIFSEAGYTVIKADETAKFIMQNDPEVRKKIISAFGQQSYSKEGLNKQYLASTIFSSPEKVDLINSIVHPPTVEKVKSLMQKALKDKNIVFHEAALIYEAQIEDQFDYVLLIKCDDELKIKRASERSGLTREQVEQRIQNQLPDSEKENSADFILNNNGSIDDLKKKAEFFLSIFESMTK